MTEEAGGPDAGRSPDHDESSPAGQTADDMTAQLAKALDSIRLPEPPPVVFPEAASSDQVTITRKQSFRAWAGRTDRLIRVANLAEESLRHAFEDAKSDLEREESRFTREYELKRFALETQVQGGGLERSGNLSAILSDLEAREVKWVRIGNNAGALSDGRPSIAITFGREARYRTLGGGVQLVVSGSDKQWVAATYDTLVTELAKSVPWWSVLLGRAAMVSYWLLAALAVYVPYIAWAPKTQDTGTIGISLGFAVGVLAIGLSQTVKWGLSDFELVEPGESTRARKLGTAIVIGIGVASGLVGIWAFVHGQGGPEKP